nr:hypothetical protein [Tanacetum cinerariifolium]
AEGPELGRMLWESIGTMYSLLEGIKAVLISRRNSLSTIRLKMSNTISEDLLARCLKVKEIIDANIARIDSIMNDKAEEETSAKEANESSYEGANNIIGKENCSKKEKNNQPTVGPTRVEPKPRRHNRMVEATEFWKKFVVSTSRTKKGIDGVLGEICGSSWDKQNTQVSISIRLSRGPYKTTYVLEELAKQHHGYYYYYLVSTKGIQRRTWDPGIQDHSKQHLEDKVFFLRREY